VVADGYDDEQARTTVVEESRRSSLSVVRPMDNAGLHRGVIENGSEEIRPFDCCMLSPGGVIPTSHRAGKRKRTSLGNLSPMTRECLHDKEPGSQAVKRISGTRGSSSRFQESSALTMARFPAAERIPSMSRVNTCRVIGLWERFTPRMTPVTGSPRITEMESPQPAGP
jgi:hypothetical protein